MKKYLGIVLAGILGLQGCGDESAKQPATANKDKATVQQTPAENIQKPQADKNEQSTKVDENYTPALWKIDHKGTTSYLFGSIHMGDESMYPLPKAVTDAYQASDALVVEVDITNLDQMEMAQKVQQLAIDPKHPLKTVLTEKTLTEYQEYCEETKSPCQAFSSFEPWLVAITLEALNMQQSGYKENLGMDLHFLNQVNDTKEIIELESIDSQLNMMDSMSAKLQDMFLYSVVSKEGDETEKLVNAWKNGSVEEFLKASFEDAKDKGIDEDDYNNFMQVFLYERNQGMADGIAQAIKSGKALFAVVGAAHYGGDKSVNHYLKEKGFTVERVDY